MAEWLKRLVLQDPKAHILFTGISLSTRPLSHVSVHYCGLSGRLVADRAVLRYGLDVVALFRPADALLRPEPGRDRGTLFARNVVQSYVLYCVSSFIFFWCAVFAIFCFFSAYHSPHSRGCKCGYLPSRVFAVSSSNPPPCRWPAGGFSHDFSLVLAPVFPSISTRARLAIVPFLWLVCRRAFSAPPATPAVCGRF